MAEKRCTPFFAVVGVPVSLNKPSSFCERPGVVFDQPEPNYLFNHNKILACGWSKTTPRHSRLKSWLVVLSGNTNHDETYTFILTRSFRLDQMPVFQNNKFSLPSLPI